MANTANLNIPKPTVGADDDTWGTTLNSGFDSFDAPYKADGTGTSVGLKVGTGKTLNALDGTVVLGDAGLTLKDTADPTKIAAFQCSGITASNTRTLTIPDRSGTIALVNPMCYAVKGSGQTVTSGAAAAVITYTAVAALTDGVTYGSNKATIGTPGYYRARISFDMTFSTLSYLYVHVRKNGTNVARLLAVVGSITGEYSDSSEYLIPTALAANDEIDVTIEAAATGTLTLQGGDPQNNSFLLELVKAT